MAYGELGPDAPLDRGPGLDARDRQPDGDRAGRSDRDRAGGARRGRAATARSSCASAACRCRPCTADAQPFEIGRAVTLRDGSRRDDHRGRCHRRPARSRPPTLLAADGIDAAVHQPVDDPADRSRRDRARRRAAARSSRSKSTRSTAGSAAPSRRSWSTTHPVRMRLLGVPGVFAPTGSAEFLLEHFGLDAAGHSRRRPRRWCRRDLMARASCPRHRPGHDEHEGPPVRRARRDRGAQASRAGRDRVPAAWLGRAGRARASGAASRRRSTTACPRRRRAQIAAVAVTNQRESVLLWERATGRPVGPVIVWQCRRTADFCETLRDRGLQAQLEATTGLTIDPLFSASKMRWLLDTIPDGDGARRARRALRGHDRQLADLEPDRRRRARLRRHQRLAHAAAQPATGGVGSPSCSSLFSIPRRRPAGGPAVERRLRRGHVRFAGSTGVPIASAIGDSHAALFGHAAFAPGQVKATYGTGSSLMTIVAGAGPLAPRAVDDRRVEPRRHGCSTRSKATSP